MRQGNPCHPEHRNATPDAVQLMHMHKESPGVRAEL